MPSAEEAEHPRKRKKAVIGKTPPTDLDVSQPAFPTDHERLDAMTRERVQSLEKDKSRHLTQIKQLVARVEQLGPENARLHEALGNARANNAISTVLMVVGGFLVSYATFTGKAAPALANASAGCLLAGIFLMLVQSALHRRKS